MIVDTPGMDDEGELGLLRIEKCKEVMAKVDIAILVVDGTLGMSDGDRMLKKMFEERNLPYITVYNKLDLVQQRIGKGRTREVPQDSIWVSASDKINITDLKDMVAHLVVDPSNGRKIIADLISEGDIVVLVTPIDEAAPKGRLILPQQQTLRDILDTGAIGVVTQVPQIPEVLASLAKAPALVVTDSQAFKEVNELVPEDIPLTSFSMLFARYKGDLGEAILSANYLDKLEDGAKILISEGCTHHRQCNDIGTVKLPKMIEKTTGKNFHFEWSSGDSFPDDLSTFDLVVHCGGCMLNPREMMHRIRICQNAGVPITNYGVIMAKMQGILPRVSAPLLGKK
ncbi:MAG TPA: [FeFe] hydrogenase H-cluster maturation GTPase HydF, partial [Clostridiales bacterium]|nr:[FeFe] hydrogenase H-cluster maturation GTPase HydF [Clostridiales bacterium]